MKIYRHCVIDIATWTIESEDSYEYEGPIAECGGGKGSKPPAAPDPVAVSGAQTQSNRDTAAFNAALNSGSIFTPLGNQTQTLRGYDQRTNAPIYDQTISLAPDVQRLLDQQNSQNLQLGNVSGSLLNQIQNSYGSATNTSSLPALRSPGTQTDYQNTVSPNGLPALRDAPQLGRYGNSAAYQGSINSDGLPSLRDAPQLGRYGNADSYQGTINTQGLPAIDSVLNLQNSVASSYRTGADRSRLPQVQNYLNLEETGPQSNYLNSVDRSGLPRLQSDVFVNGPSLRGELNRSGLPELYGSADLEGSRKQAQDALYSRQTAYLDPQYQNRERELRTRLANQGVVEGSEAYTNALNDFERARSFDYDQARNSAIIGGGDELSRLVSIAQGNRGQLFGEEATSGQFTNNARQQALAEALGRGQFNNQARAQGFDEGSADAALFNTATSASNNDRLNFTRQNNDARISSGEFTNRAQAQGFDQGTQDLQLFNQGVAQSNNDRLRFSDQANQNELARSQFTNNARQQGFSEQAAQAGFANQAAELANQARLNFTGAQNRDLLSEQAAANAARQQGFGEQAAQTGVANQAAELSNQARLNFTGAQNRDLLAEQEAGNAARAQRFGEGQANAQLYNSATSARNADAINFSNAQNSARAQGLSELFALRQQPLNEFNALRTASQVNVPQFDRPATGSVNPTDVSGNTYRSYQSLLDLYNSGQAGSNALLGGLFQLGGAALSNQQLFSDERLKENIEPVGKLPQGVGVYDYNYKGDTKRQRGVMAQEVEKVQPDAVHMDKSGYRKVDYRKVMARALAGG